MVVRITKDEFELDDGRIFPHMVELDEVPTLEEFQKTYDKVRETYKDMLNSNG